MLSVGQAQPALADALDHPPRQRTEAQPRRSLLVGVAAQVENGRRIVTIAHVDIGGGFEVLGRRRQRQATDAARRGGREQPGQGQPA